MNILIIGDVVGNPGRAIMKKALPGVFRKHDVDNGIFEFVFWTGGIGGGKICDGDGGTVEEACGEVLREID